MMTPGDVADALLSILASDHTGQAWYVQPGRQASLSIFVTYPGRVLPTAHRRVEC
jgi:hypothetical protein